LKSHLMASCVRDICAKTRQNPLILLKVTILQSIMSGSLFIETQCTAKRIYAVRMRGDRLPL